MAPRNAGTLVEYRPGSSRLHRADQALEFMRDLLVCEIAEEDRRYVLCPQPRNTARIATLLQYVRPERRLIGFHLGNRRTSIHGWKFWWRGREEGCPSLATEELYRPGSPYKQI